MNKFEFSLKNRFLKNTLELLLVALIGFLFPFWLTKIEQGSFSGKFWLSPVHAQTLSPEKVAREVYEQMPTLAQENEYTRAETNEIDRDNTLISRIVRYHQYVKARPTAFRLDWKLTLADYLGVNEIIQESRYPGYSTLTKNPLEKDREAINSLTFEQRQQLVDLLVSIYKPKKETSSNLNSSPETNPSSLEKPHNSDFQLPTPGGADLLLP
jgi:hypothetical protein